MIIVGVIIGLVYTLLVAAILALLYAPGLVSRMDFWKSYALVQIGWNSSTFIPTIGFLSIGMCGIPTAWLTQ